MQWAGVGKHGDMPERQALRMCLGLVQKLETHGQGKDISIVIIRGGCAVQWPILQHTEELWQHLLGRSA